MSLVLEIEFLTGVCRAALDSASGEPDWPPQPDRVFSALVSAWAARGRQREERMALESQTSPIPGADPEVGLFLHGIERTPAEVSLVWRSDISSLDPSDDRGAARLKVLMELMPPRAREMIEVPLWSARGWLRSERADAARLARVADVPGRDESDAFEEHGRDGQERKAFRWAGSDDPRTGVVSAADIRPSDVLVVPSDYGGCDAFGWAPTSGAAVEDVADVAARPFRGRRHTVRIAPNDAEWSRLSPILEAEGDGTSTELRERFPDILSSDAVPESVDEDPDARPVRSVREPLEALRCASNARGGRGADAFIFTWPIRTEPMSLAAIRSLLGHPGLDDPATRKAFGIVDAPPDAADFSGKFMNFARAVST